MDRQNNRISYKTIEKVLNAMYEYLQTKDKKFIEPFQEEIKFLKHIDYSITSYTEYDNLDYESHAPSRILLFLINYFGEMFFNNAELTIYNDDRSLTPAYPHTNKYKLILKDIDTHNYLTPTNPTPKDEPYDFNTVFIEQYTNNNPTEYIHAYDGFKKVEDKKNNTFKYGAYGIPKRTLDFKSAL